MSLAEPTTAVTPTVIAPSSGWVALRLGELWAYRELLYFLVWRDIKVRYKQTVIGALWVIIQPLATTLIFTLVFGRLANMPSDNVPYAIFAFAGLLPWQYFASALTNSSNSIVTSANLIRKVYFPRLTVPIASALGGLVDLAIASLVMVGMLVYFQITPTIGLLVLPLFVLMMVATALGTGMWLAALNVKYRDVRHLLPFLVQFWMFATPIVYPSSLLSEPYRTLYGINPMAGVVEGFRWALLGSQPPGAMIGVSALIALMLLISGLFFFRRTERQFADIV
jgi:lipopolysaccharide transport system permease protein